MERQEVYEKLKERHPEGVGEYISEVKSGDTWYEVSGEALQDVARTLRDDPELSFDVLVCLSGVDLPPDRMEVVYHLRSSRHGHWTVFKVPLSREAPSLPTVQGVWKGANWHEREAYDLFGIDFKGHPNMRRILLPPDWEGHPLRKDYKFPSSYRGMAGHD